MNKRRAVEVAAITLETVSTGRLPDTLAEGGAPTFAEMGEALAALRGILSRHDRGDCDPEECCLTTHPVPVGSGVDGQCQ